MNSIKRFHECMCAVCNVRKYWIALKKAFPPSLLLTRTPGRPEHWQHVNSYPGYRYLPLPPLVRKSFHFHMHFYLISQTDKDRQGQDWASRVVEAGLTGKLVIRG